MIGVFVAFHGVELFIDLGSLDEGVEDVEDGVAAPGMWIFAQQLGIVGGGICSSDAITVATEGFELVDEFVYYVPCPVVLPSGSVICSMQDIMIMWLTVGTSKSTGPSELRI